MIKIQRHKCPSTLTRGKTTKKGTRNRSAVRYNRRDVVEALYKMQRGKCCYCEQPIPARGHAKAVEHFHPKSIFKGKSNDWKNLLLACAQCNGQKSDRFPVELTRESSEAKVVYITERVTGGVTLLIDPSADDDVDPEAHITFGVDETDFACFGFALPRNGSKRGAETIKTTGIYQLHYINLRQNHHNALAAMQYGILSAIRAARATGQFDAVEAKFEVLKGKANADQPFAAYTRAFIQDKRLAETVDAARKWHKQMHG